MRCRFFFFLVFVLCPPFFFGRGIHARELTVTSASGSPGDEVSIHITADNADDIAGFACTLEYNTDYLTLREIESSFFDSFTRQWQSLDPVPDPLPPAGVTIDNTQYTQPLLSNINSGKVFLAGMRVRTQRAGATLLTLKFQISSQTPNGIYPVSISPTRLDNTAAGYHTDSPAAIPVLVGIHEGETDPGLAFPSLNVILVNGTISINTSITDTDGDGIDDNWERTYFGDLDTADQTTDSDHDGYTDLQEFLNQLNNEFDPEGNAYDPTVPNAPGGTGYYAYGSSKFWIMVLPAIISNPAP